ncbi:uncharacterized protein BDW70DRAFT_158521 [Aspergillus foveolatus]|uniref:uncharacterized protein n=1 Tax=Aspergillus foveolatus TaxID=210207 RepID=UPI003CCE4472
MGLENLNVRLSMGLDRLNPFSLFFSGLDSQDLKLGAISSERSVKWTCRQRRAAQYIGIHSNPGEMAIQNTAHIGIGAAAAQLTDEACWPHAPNTTGGPLTVLQTSKSPNGFLRSARGWNSWGIQPTPYTTPSYPKEELGRVINQEFIISQCTVLTDPAIRGAGYDLCSLDGGWYSSLTDEFGRITYNASLFDIPALSSTNVSLGLAFIDHVDKNNNCYFDYENPDTQLYHDELIALWASWGRLRTTARFERSGRKIQLDVSSDVCRSQPYWGIWNSNADSIRVDTDINAYGSDVFVNMQHVQRTVEDYRKFVNLQVVDAQNDKPVTLRANLDNLWLITSPSSIAAADFCAMYPMQPCNPGMGSNQAVQFQAWIAGPDEHGEAYVLLTNLGPNLGDGGYVTVGGRGAALYSPYCDWRQSIGPSMTWTLS